METVELNEHVNKITFVTRVKHIKTLKIYYCKNCKSLFILGLGKPIKRSINCVNCGSPSLYCTHNVFLDEYLKNIPETGYTPLY